MIAVLAVLVVLAALAGIAQLALPRIAERRIAERLSASGGTATVDVSAFPALRLLRNGGDRLVVRGSGLTIGLGDGEEVEGRRAGVAALDGFADVDIELTDLRAGPFDVAAFVLVRSELGAYAMAAEGTVTAADLVRLGDGWLRSSIPAGGLIGTLAGNAPLGSKRLPVTIELEIHSEPGGLRVGTGGGSVAGYPAGRIATAIAAAVARRLEIVP